MVCRIERQIEEGDFKKVAIWSTVFNISEISDKMWLLNRDKSNKTDEGGRFQTKVAHN